MAERVNANTWPEQAAFERQEMVASATFAPEPLIVEVKGEYVNTEMLVKVGKDLAKDI